MQRDQCGDGKYKHCIYIEMSYNLVLQVNDAIRSYWIWGEPNLLNLFFYFNN